MSPCDRERRSRPELADERPGLVGRHPFGQLGAFLDGQAERRGERLDGLAAAHVRARQDPLHGERGEQLGVGIGVTAPQLVERAQVIVVVPGPAVAGESVAEEQERHRSLAAKVSSTP